MSTPLHGFRIIDMSRAAPGKWAGGYLADYGADVITIVEPGYDQRRAESGEIDLELVSTNLRNKRSMFLNLRHEAGRAVLLELAKLSDGVIECNRPGVVRRLGVDYDAVRAANHSIVYVSLSGFGQYGPYADIGTHDLTYQGVAGLLPQDEEGKPQLPAYGDADLNAARSAAMAMVLGLLERSKSGQGQYVDVAFADACLTIPPGVPPDGGVRGELPSYNIYETKDAEYLTLAIRETAYWERLCNLLGRTDWIPHLKTSGAIGDEMYVAFCAIFKEKTLAEWMEILHEHQIQFGPVNRTVEQLRDDPQLRARDMVLETVSPITGAKRYEPGFPLKFSRTPLTLRRGPTRLGSDTEAILSELGYSAEKIAALHEAKVI